MYLIEEREKKRENYRKRKREEELIFERLSSQTVHKSESKYHERNKCLIVLTFKLYPDVVRVLVFVLNASVSSGVV